MQELTRFLQLENKKTLLFLDYDGTLTEIVNNPLQALLSDDRKQLLINLNSKKCLKIVVISGRAIEELEKVSNDLPFDMLGNHGLFFKEHGSDKITYTVDEEELKAWNQKIDEMKSYLNINILPKYEGLWLQENKHGFVLHTRQMNSNEKILLINEVHSLFNTKFKDISYSDGKEIIEVKPSHLMDKGRAIEWYLKKYYSNFDSDSVKIFAIGDDKTDEDMFIKMNKYSNGIGIKVTNLDFKDQKHATNAKIIFKSVDELYEFLKSLEKSL